MTTHMGPTRDPSQDKRLTQTESEGLETNFPSRQTGKKAGVAILISDNSNCVYLDPPSFFLDDEPT